MTIEEKIKLIVKDRPNTFFIEFNDHWCVYQTALEWFGNMEALSDRTDGVSDADKFEMIEKDSIWQVRYYDRTPVGFYVFFGVTLEKAIDQMLDALNIPWKDIEDVKVV